MATTATMSPPSATPSSSNPPPMRQLAADDRDVHTLPTAPYGASRSEPPVPSATGTAVDLTRGPDVSPSPGITGGVNDRRVKGSVPWVLKNVDGGKGSFAMMNIERVKSTKAQRYDAAKRASERTFLAAQEFNKNGYMPPRKARAHLDQAGQLSHSPDTIPRPATLSPYAGASEPQHCGLSPTDTKSEQARLLTLMRTLQPLTVVDQLCKALAYYGGIPGAPAPADGIFPPSTMTNGPGSRLISWLAEIFPNATREPQASAEEEPVGPRGRGRPRGSKNSRPRKDKGLKKGPKQIVTYDSGFDVPQTPERPSQIAAGGGTGTNWATQPDASQLAPDSANSSRNNEATPQTPSSRLPRQPDQHPDMVTPVTSSTILGSGNNVASTPGSRKRGRPKGSKNRPKPMLPATRPSLAPSTASQGSAADARQVLSLSPYASQGSATQTTTGQIYQPQPQPQQSAQQPSGTTTAPTASARDTLSGAGTNFNSYRANTGTQATNEQTEHGNAGLMPRSTVPSPSRKRKSHAGPQEELSAAMAPASSFAHVPQAVMVVDESSSSESAHAKRHRFANNPTQSVAQNAAAGYGSALHNAMNGAQAPNTGQPSPQAPQAQSRRSMSEQHRQQQLHQQLQDTQKRLQQHGSFQMTASGKQAPQPQRGPQPQPMHVAQPRSSQAFPEVSHGTGGGAAGSNRVNSHSPHQNAMNHNTPSPQYNRNIRPPQGAAAMGQNRSSSFGSQQQTQHHGNVF